MSRRSRIRTAVLVIALPILAFSACTPAGTGLDALPLVSPWDGRTFLGFGTMSTCSLLGGPITVYDLHFGTAHAEISVGANVIAQGIVSGPEDHPYGTVPVHLVSPAVTPGTCFTARFEGLTNFEPGGPPPIDGGFRVKW